MLKPIKIKCGEKDLWVFSDYHYHHNREFIFRPRGFASIEEHDETLKARWNAHLNDETSIAISLGDLAFPLPESDFIRDVKFGRLSYLDDKLGEKLDDLISEVERLAEISSHPEKVDQKFLDSLILSAYNLAP